MSIDSLDMLQDNCSGLAPIAIPEVKSSQTGVSVGYVFDPKKKWFVFRASYGRQMPAANFLIETGVYAYVPQRYEMVIKDGKRKKVLKSLLPNLIFAYLTAEDADFYVKGPTSKFLDENKQKDAGMRLSDEDLTRLFSFSNIVSYYFNHFEDIGNGKNPPIEIPDSQMRIFILGTCSHDENIVSLQKTDYHFLRDEEVEVIDGPFKGVRGRVIRAGGQQRILLRLTSTDTNNVLGEFGTAFIPKYLMRKIVK